MAIWATVVWVGRELIRQVNTGTEALVAIPAALRTEGEATRTKVETEHKTTRKQVEADHDKTRGRIHDQDQRARRMAPAAGSSTTGSCRRR